MPRRPYQRGSAAVCQKRYSSSRTTAEDHKPIQASCAFENYTHQPRASLPAADRLGASRLTRVKRPIAFLVWLCLASPAWAAGPLEYTRTALDQPPPIINTDQTPTHNLPPFSFLSPHFL